MSSKENSYMSLVVFKEEDFPPKMIIEPFLKTPPCLQRRPSKLGGGTKNN